jgi:hypothetical protein
MQLFLCYWNGCEDMSTYYTYRYFSIPFCHLEKNSISPMKQRRKLK